MVRRAVRSMTAMDQPALEAWAAAHAVQLPHGAVVLLHGELGAGKTTVVRAMLHALGAVEPATSPTYALVHRHATPSGPAFHLDAWRLQQPDDAADLDLGGLLAEARALFIEWPERLGGWAPVPHASVYLAYAADGTARTAAWR